MQEIAQEETLAQKRKRLLKEEMAIKLDMFDLHIKSKDIGKRLELAIMTCEALQAQANEIEERNEAIKSRLDEISDEIDLIEEAGN